MTLIPAFFRMKLAGKQPALRNRGAERTAINRFCRDEGRIPRHRKIRMHEIKILSSRNPAKNSRLSCGTSCHGIPSHMRNLFRGCLSRPETYHQAFQKSKTFGPRAFFAAFKKKLKAKANA